MAEDRERNQGQQGGSQQAPGRNPEDDRTAGGQPGGQERKGDQDDMQKGGGE